MTTCTYKFTGADGKEQTIVGQAAFKAFLLEGGLQQLLPSFAARMPGLAAPDAKSPFTIAFSNKQTPVSQWPQNEKPGEYEAKPGDYITVFRLANMTGLNNTNAASIDGLYTYLSMVDDYESAAGGEAADSDTIYAYKVQVPKAGFGGYEMTRRGENAGPSDKKTLGQAGRMPAKYGGFWYSFPQDTNAEQLMAIPLANARAALKEIAGSTNFDYAGTDDGVKGLRKVFADAGAPAFSAKQGEDLNAKLEQKIFSDFDAAVREYSALPKTKNGKLLDTDQARELSEEYRADRSLAPKVHEAASAFTQRAFEDRMANAPDGALVVFMAGGGGAGKSSAEHLLSDAMDRANTILDGTLSSYDKAARNVQLALDNNQYVTIAYVYREPLDALANKEGGVLQRAMQTGRAVTLDALVKGHAGSSEVVRQLEEKFGSDPRFALEVIDNSRGQGNAVFSTVDAVPVVNREGLLEKFKDATDQALAEGRISQIIYDATTSSYDTRQADGGEGQPAGVQPGAESEVQGRSESGGPRYSLRQEQKNAAASRVGNVSSDRFKRTEQLQQAVTDLQEGKITLDDYNRMVDDLRPVYPYEKVPAITTKAEATYALANGRGQSAEKAAKYGLPSDTLASGDFAQLRLDIPSYQEHDAWVVSVHTPKSTNREVQAAYDAGPVVGYESVAAMTDVTFGMNQRAATKIAQGTSKGTIATMFGKWKPISDAAAKVRADAALTDPAWTQVGMDPFRHSYFYDRDSMRPVLKADEVIQIGPLVLAKNVEFGTDKDITGASIAFSLRQQPLQGDTYVLKAETRTEEKLRQTQDYFRAVQNVQNAIATQGGTVGEAQDVYLAETLSYGRLQEQLVDFKEKTIKPLIAGLRAAGLDLSDLALYAYARHAPERNRQIASINKTFGKGEGSGMTTSEANNIINAFKAEGKEADLDALHTQLLAITQATRLVLLDEGLITQEEFDAWQKQYSDYVPLRGFVEDEQDVVTGERVKTTKLGGGRGFNIRGKESVRALGRESKAGHIIENIVSDYERAIARAERNAVAKVFLDLVTTNPDAKLWEIDTERTAVAFNRDTGWVEYNKLLDKGADTISVKIAGKEIFVKIHDPLLLRAMRQASKDETGEVTRILASSLGLYTSLMRNTLTRFNPAFGFTNAVKDLGFGAVSALADLGPKGMALYFKHYANPIQSGPMFEEFRVSGATTGGWHMRDQKELQKELQRLLDWQGASGLKSTAYTLGKNTLDALEFIGSFSETQARFAAYKAAREIGKSPAEAGRIAKELTTNFNRKGEWGSAMNTLYLFYNAGIQGSTKMLKNLKSPYVQGAMVGLAGMSAGLALFGASIGGDDDDDEAYWDKIPQFEKERNLIIMLPPGSGMTLKGQSKIGRNGRYIKIPIQYGLNVFSTAGYTLADLARHAQNPTRGVGPGKAAINTVSSVAGAFNPFGGGFDVTDPAQVALAVAPSVGDLGVQILMGVNAFGKPFAPVKSSYDKKPDSENFGPSMVGTWEQRLARWLNEKTGGDRAVSGGIDVSPGGIRNTVKNLTGGTGDFVTSVFVNIPSKLWSPDARLGPRDVPVLKAFYGEVDESTDIGLFYERKKEVMEAAQNAANRQKMGIQVKDDPQTLGLQSLGNAAKTYTEQMTRIRKDQLYIAESNLPKAEKDKKLQVLQDEVSNLASSFNKEYYSMEKAVAAGKFNPR